MFTVYIEMPLGNRSKPHEFMESADATKLFDSFVSQIKAWKGYKADVVLTDDDGQVRQLEQIRNA